MSSDYQFKRIISYVLVLFLIIGMMPMHAHAAEHGRRTATEPQLAISGDASYFVGDALKLTVSCEIGSYTEDVTAKAVLTGYDMNTAGDQTVTASYGGLTAEYAIQVREKEFQDPVTGIRAEVSVPGAAALTVSEVSADSEIFRGVSGLLRSSAGYEIRLPGHAAGTDVLVALPIPENAAVCTVYRVSDDRTIAKMDIVGSENGFALFSTDSLGAFLIGRAVFPEPLENTLVTPGTTFEKKTVYVRVDSFEHNGNYILVGENKSDGGSPIACLNNSGSVGWEGVTVCTDAITSDSVTYSDGYLEAASPNAVWTAAGNAASGYTLSNGGRYIAGTDAGTLKRTASQAVRMVYDASSARLKTAGSTAGSLSHSASGSSSSPSGNLWIYKEVDVLTSAPVTYTLQAQDVLHELSSRTARLQFSLLADGEAAELPVDAVYSFETIKDHSSIVANISVDGIIIFTNAVGSCYVKISCSWSEGTVYKYVKVTTETDPNACAHNYTATAQQPTCTEEGFVIYTCQCGHTRTEVLEALGHRYKTTVTAPTCTEEGYTTCTCQCGEMYISNFIGALGHAYEVDTVNVSCNADGYITYTCACGDSYSEIVFADGHIYDAEVIAPTCEDMGYTVYTCPCGDIYVSDYIDPPGHTYEAVTTEATCTSDGYATYTCPCGDTYSEVLKSTGHRFEAVVTAPTCTVDGFTTYACPCGESYISDHQEALGHNYEPVTAAPTCESNGYTGTACSLCGDTIVTEETPASDHSYEAVITAPTCTAEGFTTYTCACGDSYTADETQALGHSYTAAEKDGSMVYTCQCGHSYSEADASGYRLSNAFSSGAQHVITFCSDGKYYALSHADNRISVVQVAVSDGMIISAVTPELLWTYANGKLSYESDGTACYLYNASAGSWWGRLLFGSLSISSANSSTVSFSEGRLKISSLYLRFSGSSVSLRRSASTICIFAE